MIVLLTHLLILMKHKWEYHFLVLGFLAWVKLGEHFSVLFPRGGTAVRNESFLPLGLSRAASRL